MNRGGLCDVCMDPGHCCRALALSGSNLDPTKQPQAPMSHEAAEHFLMLSGHSMFRPAFQDDRGVWRYSCTALDNRTGRCTIYERRPALCERYAPGADALCVHYVPPTETQPHRRRPNDRVT